MTGAGVMLKLLYGSLLAAAPSGTASVSARARTSTAHETATTRHQKFEAIGMLVLKIKNGTGRVNTAEEDEDGRKVTGRAQVCRAYIVHWAGLEKKASLVWHIEI